MTAVPLAAVAAFSLVISVITGSVADSQDRDGKLHRVALSESVVPVDEVCAAITSSDLDALSRPSHVGNCAAPEGKEYRG
jgi:hypothetical protein